MRELKFRTWNWLEGRYDKNPCALLTISGELTPSVNRIIEQYTGLKDKNGKPIYEGDIVKFNETICIVEFDEMYARYTLRDLSDDVVIGFDALIISPFGVIGNIHENRGLLEEEEE